MQRKARIVTPLLTTAAAVVITAILIIAGTTRTQNASPTGVNAVAGEQGSQAVVQWRNAGAAYYRIGWVSLEDINAVRSESQPWLDAFAFQDVSNYGQSRHTVKGLTPGIRYAFIVGAINGRFGAAAWSDWTYLTTAERYQLPHAGERRTAAARMPHRPPANYISQQAMPAARQTAGRLTERPAVFAPRNATNRLPPPAAKPYATSAGHNGSHNQPVTGTGPT